MYNLVTAPESEPVTLAQAKEHLNVDHTDSDDYITRILKAARQYVEKRSGYQCMSASWALYLDEFPSSAVIYIEKKPVTAISKVEYYATDDATEYTELSSSDYHTDIISGPARVKIEDTPSSVGDKLNAVKVSFTAGHSSADDVPENLKQAILVLLGHLYENRQEEITGTQINQLGKGFEYLLSTDDIMTA